MGIKLKTLATGLASYVPVLRGVASKPNPSTSAHTYGVWLKHLILANQYGMQGVPRIVAELGPGMSVGTGIAALICGAELYYGLDIHPFAANESLLQTFDELVSMFEQRAPLPNRGGFPVLNPFLNDQGFPTSILSDSVMDNLLAKSRLDQLRSTIKGLSQGGVGPMSDSIRYIAPWHEGAMSHQGEIDLLFSHVVLQHIDDVEQVWRNIYQFLAPGGYATHQIDYRALGNITKQWNGHWAISPLEWKIARGRKDFFLNRAPHSAYVAGLKASGFEVLADLAQRDENGIGRKDLAPEWEGLSDFDLHTSGGFIVGRRPA